MKEIFVNTIYEQDNIVYGVAVHDHTVWKNLETIYSEIVFKVLETKIKFQPEPFYSFDKYCQFVTYINFVPDLGLSMKFIDFENDTDKALEEYTILKTKSWTKEQIQKIMKLHIEIKETNSEIAILIIEDEVLMPDF